MIKLYLSAAHLACFANDNDAFIPELWANEGLAILEENMVMSNLVHRDFEDDVKDYGDVVNTRRPGTFQIRRKADGTTLSQQDANATNVRVPLDQWFYNSFTIKDGESSKSFQDLVDVYLRPGMQTIARAVDRAVLGRAHAFIGNPADRAGRLGNLTSANASDYLLEAREKLNINKAPVSGRNLILAPSAETALLKTDMFVKAGDRGDGGSALENAELGRILGFDTFMDQNVNSITDASTDYEDGAVNNAGGYASGHGAALTVDTFSGDAVVGEFVVVSGNDQPTHLTAATGSPTTSITLNEDLKYAVADDATARRFKSCDVNGDYSSGWSQAVTLDGWGTAPQIGQLIAFGTGANRKTYTIIESWLSGASEQSVLLDRPLESSLSDNDKAFPGPSGSLNMAMHRDALALVTRPLAIPANRMGVMSHVGVYNDIAMRVSMQYDIQEGGTVVNLDILAGVAVLDGDLCVVLLA